MEFKVGDKVRLDLTRNGEPYEGFSKDYFEKWHGQTGTIIKIIGEISFIRFDSKIDPQEASWGSTWCKKIKPWKQKI